MMPLLASKDVNTGCPKARKLALFKALSSAKISLEAVVTGFYGFPQEVSILGVGICWPDLGASLGCSSREEEGDTAQKSSTSQASAPACCDRGGTASGGPT